MIGDLPEWTKYDVIFNTCLWLSPRPKLLGGIGHRVRAFQPSRVLPKIMNLPISEDDDNHLETILTDKNRNDSVVLYQSPDYEDNIKIWEALGGD
jgi:hypothetical protein